MYNLFFNFGSNWSNSTVLTNKSHIWCFFHQISFPDTSGPRHIGTYPWYIYDWCFQIWLNWINLIQNWTRKLQKKYRFLDDFDRYLMKKTIKYTCFFSNVELDQWSKIEKKSYQTFSISGRFWSRFNTKIKTNMKTFFFNVGSNWSNSTKVEEKKIKSYLMLFSSKSYRNRSNLIIFFWHIGTHHPPDSFVW